MLANELVQLIFIAQIDDHREGGGVLGDSIPAHSFRGTTHPLAFFLRRTFAEWPASNTHAVVAAKRRAIWGAFAH
jgi:hypothetical protein